MNDAMIWAEKIQNEIIEWRRELHKIPELGLFLPNTSKFVREKLDSWNISYETYEDNSGIVAILGKDTGKCVALRADMDALPIKEETELEYSSTNENMHACGHDCHTAILLGVAKILKEHEDKLNGYVKLFFQPGEEGPGGAPVMIADGCLENPHVDAIYALHVGGRDENLEQGDIKTMYGDVTAADDQFDIYVKGKGGHGAAPHMCIDPVTVATTIIQTFQTIVSREISPLEPCVITVATLQAGRGAENIISDTCYMRGTVRNKNMKNREYVLKRMEEVVKGICLAMRADYSFKLDYGYVPVVNEKDSTDLLIECAKETVGSDNVKVCGSQQMGGEDAGFYYQLVPGCFFNLICQAPFKDGKIYPAHNSKFVVDDSLLYRGTAVFVDTAIKYLNK